MRSLRFASAFSFLMGVALLAACGRTTFQTNCAQDSDCEGGLVCSVDGNCVPADQIDGGDNLCHPNCPTGQTCLQGKCVGGPACGPNKSCPVGEICTNGVCV